MADEAEGEVSSTGGGLRQPAAEKGPARRDASHLPVSYTIAAVLPEAATAPSVLHGLEQLAKLLPAARLVALHVEVDPRHLVADDEEIVVQRLREKREGTAAERAVAVRKVFDEWWHSNGSIGARTTWRKLVGAEETALIQAMKDIDLAILPRPGNLDSQDALHAAIFSHRLVLIMPPSAAAGTGFCRHVAIGWKPGKLVDEVVLLSMPILRIAERVTLLAIDQQNADFSHDYVLRTLVELGVEPELIRIDSSGSQVGHRLLDESRRIGAGSLIVGAYRRGQMIEQILGGVTRELVAQSDIPLFLAH